MRRSPGDISPSAQNHNNASHPMYVSVMLHRWSYCSILRCFYEGKHLDTETRRKQHDPDLCNRLICLLNLLNRGMHAVELFFKSEDDGDVGTGAPANVRSKKDAVTYLVLSALLTCAFYGLFMSICRACMCCRAAKQCVAMLLRNL